jgi:predicted ATPase
MGLSLVRSHASNQRIDRVTLLERKSALDALAEFTGEARGGEGRLVLLEGEAGVGKTALLEHFTFGLPDSRVLSGACDGMFTPRPLGPLFDIAQQVHGRLYALGNWRCGAPLTSATHLARSRRRGSSARRCARLASGPFRLGSEPQRARIRSA